MRLNVPQRSVSVNASMVLKGGRQSRCLLFFLALKRWSFAASEELSREASGSFSDVTWTGQGFHQDRLLVQDLADASLICA
jgi:hypothetical protein